MVAQAQKTQTRKSTYRPHVRLVDASRGLYTVQSQTYIYVLYGVDVVLGTCECEAGQQGFRNCMKHGGVCKHVAAARAYHAYRQNPSHIRPVVEQEEVAAAMSWEELAAEFAALPEPINIRDYMARPTVVIPATESLMECFA